MQKAKKTVFAFLAFIMAFGLLPAGLTAAAAGPPVSVAEWNYTADPGLAQIPATGGVHQSGAELTHSNGGGALLGHNLRPASFLYERVERRR